MWGETFTVMKVFQTQNLLSCGGIGKETTSNALAVVQQLSALAAQALLTGLARVEVVLARLAGHQLSILRHFNTLGIRLVCFHSNY